MVDLNKKEDTKNLEDKSINIHDNTILNINTSFIVCVLSLVVCLVCVLGFIFKFDVVSKQDNVLEDTTTTQEITTVTTTEVTSTVITDNYYGEPFTIEDFKKILKTIFKILPCALPFVFLISILRIMSNLFR